MPPGGVSNIDAASRKTVARDDRTLLKDDGNKFKKSAKPTMLRTPSGTQSVADLYAQPQPKQQAAHSFCQRKFELPRRIDS
jgi:hypothetical protein